MNQNLPAAPAYVEGIHQIRTSTPVKRILGFVGALLGFELGRKLGESLRRPTGNQLRRYCANTSAVVDLIEDVVKEGEIHTWTINAVETIKTEAQVPIRLLVNIATNNPEEQVAIALQQAELIVKGYNQAWQDLTLMSRADCRQVDAVIADALDKYQHKFDAEQAQANPVETLEAQLATN